jgi:hypothetical protein
MIGAKYANLAGIKITVSQPEDCCGSPDADEQYLAIETADGGGGKYIVIQTDRWALDSDSDIDALAAHLKEIMLAASSTTTSPLLPESK